MDWKTRLEQLSKNSFTGGVITALDVKNRAKAFQGYIDNADEPFDPDNDPFFTWKRH